MQKILKRLWIVTSLVILSLPVCKMPYIYLPGIFSGLIEFGLMSMLVLSFPLSLMTFPLMSFVELLGLSPDLYLELFLFLTFGYLQWFWIIPRLLKRRTVIESLFGNRQIEIFNIRQTDQNGQTPLERIIKENEVF